MVDLSLAVNYIPACLLICKAVVLLLLLETMQLSECYSGVILLVCLLCVDRLYTRLHIFDANSILFFLTLGYFATLLRGKCEFPHWMLGEIGSCFFELLWVVFSLYMQHVSVCLSPNRLILHFSVSALFVSVVPFLSVVGAPESHVLKMGRGGVFCVMCVAWSYIVAIYRKKMMKAGESGVYFVIYFSPCMFVHLYLMIGFSVTVLLFVLIKLAESEKYGVQKHRLEPIREEEATVVDPETEELTMLLRQAKDRVRTLV